MVPGKHNGLYLHFCRARRTQRFKLYDLVGSEYTGPETDVRLKNLDSRRPASARKARVLEWAVRTRDFLSGGALWRHCTGGGS